MSSAPNRLVRAGRHLDLVEEAWKSEHDASMRCRDFEDHLAELVMLFHFIENGVQHHRELVFRGLEETDSGHDDGERDLYTRWLALADKTMPKLEAFEQTFGALGVADRFRNCRERARTFLEKWVPAALSQAVGLRVLEFDEEDADQIHALLESPPGAPGRPTCPARSVLAGDAFLLR